MRHVQLVGPPIQPQFIIPYQWFWWMTLPISGAPTGWEISWECSNPGLWVGRGPTSSPSSWGLVKCPGDSLWGLFPKDTPSSGLQKVTCLSSLCQLRDLSHLSGDLPHQQLWLQGHQCGMSSTSWLNLSMFNSSMWAASSAH